MPDESSSANKNQRKEKLIEIGYISAITLAFLGLLTAGAYLFFFSIKSPPASDWKMETMVALSAERRMVLLSTAIFVALSFSCMAFALFLLQAKGDVSGEGQAGEYKIKLTNLSPGLFLFLCATIIIIVATTFKIQYGLTSTAQGEQKSYEQANPQPKKSIIQNAPVYDSSKHEYQ